MNSALREPAQAVAAWVKRLRAEIAGVIVGQDQLVDRLLVGLLANGHVLLEGVPGLAKTLSVRTLAAAVQASFRRIQFTPDLLPADIVGTLIYSPQDGKYHATRGPVFANFLLADEINRAPAKVQSALLEAMQERQITLGGETMPLPSPFLVLATENPIDQEGTGLGAEILRKHGASQDKLKAEIAKLIQASLEDTWVFGRLPGTPHFRNVVALAIEEAQNLKSKEVGTEHLLLGLLGEKGCVAHKALKALGLNAKLVRETLVKMQARQAEAT